MKKTLSGSIPLLAFAFTALVGCKVPDPIGQEEKILEPAAVPAPVAVNSNRTPAPPQKRSTPTKKSTPYVSKGLRNKPVSLAATKKANSVTYRKVSTSRPLVAMTFDDGPHPVHTPRLLKILAERNIKATFFVTGRNVKAYPAVARQIVSGGHEIANHTFSHPYLTKLSDASMRNQMDTTHNAIVAATGRKPRVMRPPYGATNTRVKNLMYEEYGYPNILWSVDPQDWKKPGINVVADRLIKGSHNGAILLAHDIHAPTISAMPRALDGILERGFQFVTVSQLLSLDKSASPAFAKPKPEPAPEKEKKETVVVEEETVTVTEEIPEEASTSVSETIETISTEDPISSTE